MKALKVDANYLFQDEMENIQIDFVCSFSEQPHIKKFRTLNEEGQRKVIAYTDDLVLSGKYLATQLQPYYANTVHKKLAAMDGGGEITEVEKDVLEKRARKIRAESMLDEIINKGNKPKQFHNLPVMRCCRKI